MTHSFPHPRNYQTFNDYWTALEEWDWQQDQWNDPDGSKKREAEMRTEIWARFAREGRVPRCIPSCRKPMCLEREGCIWVEMQIIQDLMGKWFFQNSLPIKYLLIDPNAYTKRSKRGLCSVLPVEWQKDGTRQHAALRFFLNVWDHFSLADRSEAASAFCRDAYLRTVYELKGIPYAKEEMIRRMSGFFQTDPNIPRMTAVLLSQELEFQSQNEC